MSQQSAELPFSNGDLEARINEIFPRVIGIDEFEKLFEYVTDQIQGEIRYHFEGQGNIGNMFSADDELLRKRERYVNHLSGSITMRVKYPRSLYLSKTPG